MKYSGINFAAFVFLCILPLAACEVGIDDATQGAMLLKPGEAHAEADKHDGHDHDEDAAPMDDHDEASHAAEEQAASHDEVGHAGHGHDSHGSVSLTEKSRVSFGVAMATAGPLDLNTYITIPGEISVNEDRFAHVTPRVGGVVIEVLKSWGDPVERGEPLAVLESRELGVMKAAYLSAVERRSLAKAMFDREKRLWEKKITSEQEYLNARKNYADADIIHREKRQALFSLGIPEEHLENIVSSSKESLTRYDIIAPFAGVVLDKHLALGEAVEANSTVYQVGDLTEVWANLSVYQKDLGKVRKGASVLINGPDSEPEGWGTISYIRPILGEQTRTALARVILSNKDGQWRPGLFVEARVSVDSFTVPLAVEASAIQTKEGRKVVFVENEDGDFVTRKVVTGRSDGIHVEIVGGLEPGDRYVSEGSFVVKAESEKESFGGHGHAH